MGYHVGLVFLRLPSVDQAIQRVRVRVAQGGHDIPEQAIRRRFDRGWAHFQNDFRPLVNAWRVFDASVLPPILIDSGGHP